MKKKIKEILSALTFAAVMTAGCQALNYALVSYDPFSRILMHSYYEQENIDTVFVGSSHVYCDINPTVFDQVSGRRSFNMASPGQRWDNSYDWLRDAVSRYDIRHVYLECYYWNMTESDAWFKTEKVFKAADFIDDPINNSRPWLLTDEMKPSLAKYRMLAGSAGKSYFMETWLPFVRYRGNIFNYGLIQQNMIEKNSDEYLQYTHHEEHVDADGNPWIIEYRDRGYYYSEGGRFLDSEKLFCKDRDLQKYGIGEKSESYLRKTIAFCQKNNIEVSLFISPVNDLQLISTGDYDGFLEELRAVANDCQVPLYDFNLLKKEVLNIRKSEYFMDVDHLNGIGSELFTPVLWNVLNASENENKNKFYHSYSEKLAADDPELFGLYYTGENPGEAVMADGRPVYTVHRYTVASNRTDMEYRLTKITDEGSEELIRDYSTDTEFALPADEHGTIRISARNKEAELQLDVTY